MPTSRRYFVPPVCDFTRVPRLGASIDWAASHAGGEGFAELLRAVKVGRIAFTAVLRHRAAWTPRSLKSALPTIVLIADDFGDSRDPDEWRCSMSAIAWARSAIVHGCGAERWHYQEAITAAEVTGRCLFVETDSDHVAAWSAVIAPRCIPALHIIPRTGQKHPAAEPARGHA